MAPVDLALDGTVFLVTGGSRGLGYATAQVLVQEGARVVLCGRDEARVAAAAASLGGSDHALGVAADLAEAGSETRLVAAAHGRWDRLDGALVSVGGPAPGPTSSLDDEAWRRSFESVFLGAVRVVRAVARQSGDAGCSIALVLSTSVRAPLEGLGASNGLRPGLAMVAKELSDELGPYGVRINGLLPGRIDTDRVRELDGATGRPAAAGRLREAGIPLRRYGEPLEFGRAAAFLLSPASSYVTGTMLPVDGGASRGV